MRDPYHILGITRGATFDEVKAAYRRACKLKHPDMGGSQEAFLELQDAYEAILTELRRGYQEKRQHTAPPGGPKDEREDRRWESAYRDIDDELEEIRRSARAREEALREMRVEAWHQGERLVWAKLTWQDITRFMTGIIRSGLKGLALLSAALIGLGSVLIEANAVSAIIMLGGGLGFVVSQALKSDKGGMLSAGLLLFGIMTIWLPPVRHALIHYPVATVSLLFCLALIFKFGQQSGMVGLMTGGVLTLYVVGTILTRTPQLVPVASPPTVPDRTPPGAPEAGAPGSSPPRPAPEASKPSQPAIPAIRELIASKGAILKFVSGVSYRLKIRGGFTTSLAATRGYFAEFRGDEQVGTCTAAISLSAPESSTPYTIYDSTFRGCGTGALLVVNDVR